MAAQCALAHILPGQPMSMDRKNKRAAQAALREANHPDGTPSTANGNGASSSPGSSSQPPTSPNQNQQPRQQQLQHAHAQAQSGIGRSLKNSLDLGRPAPSVGAVGDQPWASRAPTTPTASTGPPRPTLSAASSPSPISPFPQQGLRSPPSAQAALFGSGSDSDEHRSPPPVPRLGPAATFLKGPSGLTQTLGKQPPPASANGTGRSTVAAQVMLSQQGRRLSNNSDSLSPSRPRLAGSNGFVPDHLGGSSPAVPLAAPNPPATANGIFSTSPFSGSRALFLPSSYDSGSGDDAFPRSPPRTRTNGGPAHERDSFGAGWDDTGDDGDEDEDDEFSDQGFLPSSLSDLLTPEEQRRRASKSSGFDPFQNSRSVPAELMLARGRPTPMPYNAWGTLTSTSGAGTAPAPTYATSPPAQRSLLSVGYAFATSPPSHPSTSYPDHPNSLQSQIWARNTTAGHYSASFDPSSAFRAPQPTPPPVPASLPGGLAAGLSQLHLVPASHTGETPPSDGAWGGTPLSWGSVASNASEHHAHYPANGLKVPPGQPVPRRPSANGQASYAASAASPLHHSVRSGYPGAGDDEIQFDMDA